MPFAVWSQPSVTSLCRGSICESINHQGHGGTRRKLLRLNAFVILRVQTAAHRERHRGARTHPQPGWEEAFPEHQPAVKTIGKTLYLRVEEVLYSKMRDQDLTY